MSWAGLGAAGPAFFFSFQLGGRVRCMLVGGWSVLAVAADEDEGENAEDDEGDA